MSSTGGKVTGSLYSFRLLLPIFNIRVLHHCPGCPPQMLVESPVQAMCQCLHKLRNVHPYGRAQARWLATQMLCIEGRKEDGHMLPYTRKYFQDFWPVYGEAASHCVCISTLKTNYQIKNKACPIKNNAVTWKAICKYLIAAYAAERYSTAEESFLKVYQDTSTSRSVGILCPPQCWVAPSANLCITTNHVSDIENGKRNQWAIWGTLEIDALESDGFPADSNRQCHGNIVTYT